MIIVFAHVSARPAHWLVRLIIPGVAKPLWRRYRRADVPDEEATINRAMRHLRPRLADTTQTGPQEALRVQRMGRLGEATSQGADQSGECPIFVHN